VTREPNAHELRYIQHLNTLSVRPHLNEGLMYFNDNYRRFQLGYASWNALYEDKPQPVFTEIADAT